MVDLLHIYDETGTVTHGWEPTLRPYTPTRISKNLCNHPTLTFHPDPTSNHLGKTWQCNICDTHHDHLWQYGRLPYRILNYGPQDEWRYTGTP